MTIRAVATGLFGFITAAIVTAFISANVREFARQRGWDTFLVRWWDALPEQLRDELRWERLRGLWWLWSIFGSIFGLSGGVALTLWLTPFLSLGPSAEVVTLRQENDQMSGEARKTQVRLADIESELEGTKRQLGSTTQALEAARQPTATAPPVSVFLNGGIGLIQVPYIRNMGPMTTLNRFSLSKDIWRKLVVEDTAVVITAPKENMLLKVNLESIFGVGLQDIRDQLPHGRPLLVQPPNYEIEIDAPRLKDSGYSGIIIHGHSSALELLDNLLRDCFVTRQTPKIAGGLTEYYKAHNVVWIEIGKGSPWKSPSVCWD